MLLETILLLLVSGTGCSQSIIKRVPGFSGDLPFNLRTGYVGVGDLDDVQLFYYFIESESSPEDDPLLLWLAGGPGCSGLSPLVYEIGPLVFDYENHSSENLPTFLLNSYSWTKVANIIFLDSPVGTGFSYSRTWEGYRTGDALSATQTYNFLRKWLTAHPEFLKNPLYIAGDSYSGQTVPLVVQEISNGNEVGHDPAMNLKGYILGNPFTDINYDRNSRILFAHEKALLSDELYESIRRNCKGEHVHVDPGNFPCLSDLQVFYEIQANLFTEHISEPKCSTLSLEPTGFKWETYDMNVPRCRHYNYLLSSSWTNNKSVQNALHVRENTVKEWQRCNKSLHYTRDTISRIGYHRNFTKTSYRALVYSGDHDIVVPYIGTHNWIKSLNLTIVEDWQPWLVNGQIAGYKIGYSKEEYDLTFATVKGAGHTAPEYKRDECLAMIVRWFSQNPL